MEIPQHSYGKSPAGELQPLLRKRGILILDSVILLAAILAFPLGKMLLDLPFDCYVQSIGYLCPACGGTRAVLLLLRGDVLGAVSMNAYFMVTGLIMALGVVFLHFSCFTDIIFFRKISRGLFHPYTAIVLAIGFLLFGFFRNII